MNTARTIPAAIIGIAALALAGCTTESSNVDKNLATDAENFKIARKVSFVNGITDKVLVEIQGLCSVDPADPNRVSVTCKTEDGKYVRNFLGKADNVFYVVEQLEATNASTSAYRLVLRPESLIPDVTVRTP